MTRVLIVDDRVENLHYLETLLRKNGYVVDSAGDGAEALAKARKILPDLIISDLLMPIMDGYTLLRHWKTDVSFSQIPFIIFTATFTAEDDQLFGQNLGADAFIFKTVRAREFLARVQEVLEVAVGASRQPLDHTPVEGDETTLKYYSQRLIHKLEEKTRQLEQTNLVLQLEIKAHQEADEEIRFRNTIMNTQLQNSLDAILVINDEGNVLSFNEQFTALWGISGELLEDCRVIPLLQSAFVIQKMRDLLVDPETYLKKMEYLQKHVQDKSLEEVHFRNGNVIEVYSVPAIGPTDRYYGRIWYYRDVTKSRKAKASLEASVCDQRQLTELLKVERSRLLHAQQIAKVGSWELDLVSMMVVWSDEVHRIFGTDPAKFQTTYTSFLKFVHPDDRAAVDKAVNDSMGQTGVSKIEHRILLADGQIKFVEENWRIFRDEQGKPVRALGTCLDTTTHKLLLDSLREQAVQLSNAQRIGRMGGWSLDTSLGKVYWSEEVRKLHDMPVDFSPTQEEVIGFYAEEFREIISTAFSHCLDRGISFDLESQLVTAGGRRVWVRTIGEAFGAAGNNPRQIHGVIQDISEQKAAQDEIHGLGNRLIETLESISDGFVTIDHDWNFAYINVQAERLLQRSRDELLGRNVWQEFKEAVGTRMQHNYERAMRENVTLEFEEFYPPLNKWLEINVYPSHYGLAIYFRDVSKRKETEAQLAYLHRVRAVLSGINALIIRAKSRDELFREACHIAYDSGQFLMAMLCVVNPVTSKIEPVASQGKDEALMSTIRSTLASESRASDTMVVRAIKNNTQIVSNDSRHDPQVLFGDRYKALGVQSMAVLPLATHHKSIGALVLYAREIGFFQKDEMSLLTELADDIAFAVDHIEKQERLDYLANFDTLTGLANRELFLERLEQYMKQAATEERKLALCLINLERFKSINDTLGRASGDVLLQLVAEWLIRYADVADLVGRIGADQFAVVFNIRPEGNLIKLFEASSRAFQENLFVVDGTRLRMAAKTGIALFPDDGTDAEALLRNAEVALKRAKVVNERFMFYSREMNIEVASRLILENQLRQAVANEEFILYYQPKVSLVSGKLTGAEALIRWKDPQGNLVLPGKFIPILEETGMIADVGRWALQKAMEDFLRWRKAGLPAVRIAVNVSPLQLNHRNFIADLEHHSSIDEFVNGGLELEITEGVIMENIGTSTASLKAIRAMGITIAIDDFGTGFSSLSYLAKLPVDSLKIDRSFVVDMTQSPEGLALVTTIIDLAHALNLKVVAEGVETEKQMRMLRLLKCDDMQGYLISRPVPVDDFEKQFLQENFNLTTWWPTILSPLQAFDAKTLST